MTPEQVLEIRNFWLRHHKELPKPEPTFKEVTMYAPVVKSPWGECLSIQGLAWNSIENVMRQDGAIGYAEVKVFLKEGEK